MENWVERKTPQGRPYFCNLVTQETTWDFDEIDSETGRLVCKKNEKIQVIFPPLNLSYCLNKYREKQKIMIH